MSPKVSPFAQHEHERIYTKPPHWIDSKVLNPRHLDYKRMTAARQSGMASIESPPLRFDKALQLQGLVFSGFTRSDCEAFDPVGLELA